MEMLLVPPKIRSLVRDAALELYMDSVWDGQRGAGSQRESASQAFTFLICMGFKRMIEVFFVMKVFTVVSSILSIYKTDQVNKFLHSRK